MSDTPEPTGRSPSLWRQTRENVLIIAEAEIGWCEGSREAALQSIKDFLRLDMASGRYFAKLIAGHVLPLPMPKEEDYLTLWKKNPEPVEKGENP